ncbi:MAG: hypothetical protein PHG23_01845 [Candidatus Pacebacteria bacterium]|nr:hypothetical protein [Candidatus Paceibacterota bacterium]
MKKQIIFLVALVVIVAGAVFYYFNFVNKLGFLPAGGNSPVTSQDSDKPYVGDDFTFIPPAGWIRVEMPRTLVAYQNAKEIQPKGSAAEKVHFKSYFAVSFDNANGQKLNEVADLVKQQIKNAAPGFSFVSETEGIIGGQPAEIVEGDLLSQDVNFKVMVATVLSRDKYFTISANTTAEKWPEYRDVFYNVLESFEFK